MDYRHFGIVIVLGQILLCSGAEPLRADLIKLANGGELRGGIEWSRQAAASPQIEIRTLSGAVVTVERKETEFVTRRRMIIEIYESRAKQTPQTVEDQWEMARWCREHQLVSQRRIHLQNIVDLDPDHKLARKQLGHLLHNGQWMTREQAMLAQGYLKHKGRYVTRQEWELLEKKEDRREAEIKWHKKIRLWYLWTTGRNTTRQETGLRELQNVNHPDAIPALSRFLQNHENIQYRSLFLRILRQIPGEGPVRFLVSQSLHDEASQIRNEAFEAISPELYATAIPFYLSELNHGFNLIVRRAASALGKIGDEDVVPQLIEALVTTHRYRVRVPTNEGSVTFGTDGSFGGSNRVLPQGVEQLLRTGQLPYGVIVNQPAEQVRTKVVTVKHDHQNPEALAALTKLTGESFGYNERSWRLWWTSRQNDATGVIAQP